MVGRAVILCAVAALGCAPEARRPAPVRPRPAAVEAPARGAARTEPAPPAGGATLAPRPGLDRAVERLRSAVHELATARALELEPRAAAALVALARALGDAGAPEDAVKEVRRRADRLADRPPASLERADDVAAGLVAALSALDALARGDASLARWVAAARPSVAAVDPGRPLGLQRAVVQDAFRALADVLAAFAARR